METRKEVLEVWKETVKRRTQKRKVEEEEMDGDKCMGKV